MGIEKNHDGDRIVPKRIFWGLISAIIFFMITTAWGWKDDLGVEKLGRVMTEIGIVKQLAVETKGEVWLNTEFRIDTNRRLQNIEQRVDAIARRVDAIARKVGADLPPKQGGNQ